MSSEFSVPVFISSTVYDLVDVRADLHEHLASRGFRPILSTDEGFPDQSPEFEPWESCLPPLAECFVVVVIIDGRYGQPFKWAHFKEFFQDRELSPTHAEFLFAKAKRKRLFVFVRDRLLEFYQSYRKVAKKHNNDTAAMRAALEPILPEWVQFDTLAFLNEVKTTKPIPWICPFKDSRQLRLEIERKMINELYAYYTFQQGRFDSLMHHFRTALEALSPEEQRKVLGQFGMGQELIDTAQKNEKEAKELAQKVREHRVEIEKVTRERDAFGKSKSVERDKMNAQLEELQQQVDRLEGELKEKNDRGLDAVLVGKHLIDYTKGFQAGPGVWDEPFLKTTVDRVASPCTRCGNLDFGMMGTRQCVKCGRAWCSTCWPHAGFAIGPQQCPDCSKGLFPKLG